MEGTYNVMGRLVDKKWVVGEVVVVWVILIVSIARKGRVVNKEILRIVESGINENNLFKYWVSLNEVMNEVLLLRKRYTNMRLKEKISNRNDRQHIASAEKGHNMSNELVTGTLFYSSYLFNGHLDNPKPVFHDSRHQSNMRPGEQGIWKSFETTNVVNKAD